MARDTKLTTAVLLYNEAARIGLEPSWIVENKLFAVETPIGEQFINRGVSGLNPTVSTSLVRNKLRTRIILERYRLPNIPFINTRSYAVAEKFLEQHGMVVIKPNRGEGSKDIRIVSSKQQLRSVGLSGKIIERYTPGREMRYLVLSGNVIAVHESIYGTSVDTHRHLQRVSYPTEEWDSELTATSLKICQIFSLNFAAIDYLVDKEGAHILEVNSSPGFKWFHSPTSGPVVDVAKLFLANAVRHWTIGSKDVYGSQSNKP